MGNLTEMQTQFVEEYLRDGNAKQAAIRAGYSPASSAALGSRLRQNPAIVAAIKERAGKAGITSERILRELACIAFLRVDDILEVCEGRLVVRDTMALPDVALGAVACIKEGAHGLEVKTFDKLRALDLLCRVMGLYDRESEPVRERVCIIDDA